MPFLSDLVCSLQPKTRVWVFWENEDVIYIMFWLVSGLTFSNTHVYSLVMLCDLVQNGLHDSEQTIIS